MAYPSTNWFIPGDGIERAVISSSIQRYLGNDATVRPGLGKDEYQGIQGYWINAYRNLTSRQQEDLKDASRKYRNEQRKQQPQTYPPDTRMPNDYGRSYQQPGYAPPANPYPHTGPPLMGRSGGDSPNGMDSGYPGAGPRDRYTGPPPQHRMDDMDVDMSGGYGQPPRHRYDDDPRARYNDGRMYDDRPQYHDTRPPYAADPYGYRPQTGSGNFGIDPRTSQDYRPDTRGPQYGGLQGNYGRQPEPSFGGYPPMPPATAPPAMQPPYGTNAGYQPPPGPPPSRMNQGLDGRDLRYQTGPPNDFASDRDAIQYAYPSPATTVVGKREGLPSAPSPRWAAIASASSEHSLTLLNSAFPAGPSQPSPNATMYGYDGRAAPTTLGGTAAYPPITSGGYNSGTSPTTLPRQAPGRRGEGSEDGEPPRTRPRYG